MINVKSNNRYLVAKYAPDLRRMETHNIGVVLWAEGTVVSRFLREKDATFIQDLDNYKRWREFWAGEIGADVIKPLRGQPVSKTSPDFLDVLRATQEGNYMLFDGGCVYEELVEAGVREAADFLFDELVATRHPKEEIQDHESLTVQAERLVEDAGLPDEAGYTPNYPLICPIFGVKQSVQIDFAIVDDKPQSFVQQVSLKNASAARNAALLFHSIASAGILTKAHCCAIVDSTEPHANDKLLAMMRKVSKVADLADRDQARLQLRKVARIAG